MYDSQMLRFMQHFTFAACVLVSYGNAIAERDVFVHRSLPGHGHGIVRVSRGWFVVFNKTVANRNSVRQYCWHT